MLGQVYFNCYSPDAAETWTENDEKALFLLRSLNSESITVDGDKGLGFRVWGLGFRVCWHSWKQRRTAVLGSFHLRRRTARATPRRQTTKATPRRRTDVAGDHEAETSDNEDTFVYPESPIPLN